MSPHTPSNPCHHTLRLSDLPSVRALPDVLPSPSSLGTPTEPLFLSVPRVPAAGAERVVVVRTFVDFWNFHLTMSRWRTRFRLDWSRLGPSLTDHVGAFLRASGRPARVEYGGLHLYLSYNPAAPRDEKLRRWAQKVLARFDGVHMVLKARRPKDPPRCPSCHVSVETCPCCRASMRRTTEKGMDTAIVTDMVRLAWDGSWDVAVLASTDGDFVPAVEHLEEKGHAVVHAGFPPHRSALSRACSASLDMGAVLPPLERALEASDPSAPPSGHATAGARRVLTEKHAERQAERQAETQVAKKNRSAGSENRTDRGLTG
jgi:uncharacterized LabA/DUF88 family protein